MDKETEKPLGKPADIKVPTKSCQTIQNGTSAELEFFRFAVSHDLRSPLRAIDGYSFALLQEYSDVLDEKAQQYLARIRINSQRMDTLLDDLLSLSVLSQQPLQRSNINLTALITDIAARQTHANPEHPVRITVHENMTIQYDPDLATILMTHLIDNAWKFTAQENTPTVEVGFLQGVNQSVIFIKDNGVGFDMQYSQDLLKPFRRLHQADEYPGNGIGLAIAQLIIDRHGGKIWFDATPQQGATFYFSHDAPPV